MRRSCAVELTVRFQITSELVGFHCSHSAWQIEMPHYGVRIERDFLITVEGFDWNCPQHIAERYTLDEVRAVTARLTTRIAELEAELARRPMPQPAE